MYPAGYPVSGPHRISATGTYPAFGLAGYPAKTVPVSGASPEKSTGTGMYNKAITFYLYLKKQIVNFQPGFGICIYLKG
jgi:hypothetical protein